MGWRPGPRATGRCSAPPRVTCRQLQRRAHHARDARDGGLVVVSQQGEPGGRLVMLPRGLTGGEADQGGERPRGHLRRRRRGVEWRTLRELG